MEKNHVRKIIASQLKEYPLDERLGASLRIYNRLWNLREWKEARTIGITLSKFPEIDTRPIIEKAWSEQKRIAVPISNLTDRTLDFRIIRSFKDTVKGHKGIFEPLPSCPSIKDGEMDLCIVPGIAFNSSGFRVGYGGGFYDRYLFMKKLNTLSLCFDFQLAHNFPIFQHDVPVRVLLTETRIIEGLHE